MLAYNETNSTKADKKRCGTSLEDREERKPESEVLQPVQSIPSFKYPLYFGKRVFKHSTHQALMRVKDTIFSTHTGHSRDQLSF
jgi:hypothetical protein